MAFVVVGVASPCNVIWLLPYKFDAGGEGKLFLAQPLNTPLV